MSYFKDLPDAWLDTLAVACEAAAGEGVFGNAKIVDALRAEFVRRDRSVPLAYGEQHIAPADWMTWVAS